MEPALSGRIRIENAPPPPDVTAPVLTLPGDITVEAPDGSGTTVNYYVAASDDRDPSPTVACTPESGSVFPVGSTTVTCQATDRSGNVATGTFVVRVLSPLTLEISANQTGTVDRSGNVTVSGTVSCSRDVPVYMSGTVKQLFAGRVTISGSFSIQVNCVAPQSTWSAVVVGDNGKFAAGSAMLTVNAYGCELSCHAASVSQSIRLSGRR